MSTIEQHVAAIPATPERSLERVATDPDPSWRGLYRAGGVSAFLYILLALGVPAVLFMPSGYERGMDGASLLTFIANNRLWWVVLQTMMLGVASFFAIVVFMAIFVSLRHLNKSYAAIGAAIAITCQALFVAYLPTTLGIAYLSEQYTTSGADRQASLAAAAQGLIAVIDAFNPLYESAFAVGILIVSLVMLRGVFHKAVAYLGLATGASAFIALSLWPVLGIGYFWWWLLFVVWFIAVGWRLYRLGGESRRLLMPISDGDEKQ